MQTLTDVPAVAPTIRIELPECGDLPALAYAIATRADFVSRLVDALAMLTEDDPAAHVVAMLAADQMGPLLADAGRFLWPYRDLRPPLAPPPEDFTPEAAAAVQTSARGRP